MEPLRVTVSHRLGKTGAKQRIRERLDGIHAQIAAIAKVEEERWDGDRLIFRLKALGQTLSGVLTVREAEVEVEVVLPLMLRIFGDRLARRLDRDGTRLLAAPAPTEPGR